MADTENNKDTIVIDFNLSNQMQIVLWARWLETVGDTLQALATSAEPVLTEEYIDDMLRASQKCYHLFHGLQNKSNWKTSEVKGLREAKDGLWLSTFNRK